MTTDKNFSYVYDAKTNGFYAISLRDSYEIAGVWPSDGREITKDEHRFLMDGQSAGKVVSADSKGRPILTNMVIDYVALATAERDRRMTVITARIIELTEAQDDGDITDKELAELAELREVRTNLRRLNLTNAPHIEWPEVPEDVA